MRWRASGSDGRDFFGGGAAADGAGSVTATGAATAGVDVSWEVREVDFAFLLFALLLFFFSLFSKDF